MSVSTTTAMRIFSLDGAGKKVPISSRQELDAVLRLQIPAAPAPVAASVIKSKVLPYSAADSPLKLKTTVIELLALSTLPVQENFPKPIDLMPLHPTHACCLDSSLSADKPDSSTEERLEIDNLRNLLEESRLERAELRNLLEESRLKRAELRNLLEESRLEGAELRNLLEESRLVKSELYSELRNTELRADIAEIYLKGEKNKLKITEDLLEIFMKR